MRPSGRNKGMRMDNQIICWDHIISFVLQQIWFLLHITNLNRKGIYYQEYESPTFVGGFESYVVMYST